MAHQLGNKRKPFIELSRNAPTVHEISRSEKELSKVWSVLFFLSQKRKAPLKTPLFYLVFTDVNTPFVHVVNSPLFLEQQKCFTAGSAGKKSFEPCKGLKTLFVLTFGIFLKENPIVRSLRKLTINDNIRRRYGNHRCSLRRHHVRSKFRLCRSGFLLCTIV